MEKPPRPSIFIAKNKNMPSWSFWEKKGFGEKKRGGPRGGQDRPHVRPISADLCRGKGAGPLGKMAPFLHTEFVLQCMSLSSYTITFHVLSNFIESSKKCFWTSGCYVVHVWVGRSETRWNRGRGQGSFSPPPPSSSRCWGLGCQEFLLRNPEAQSGTERVRGAHPWATEPRAHSRPLQQRDCPQGSEEQALATHTASFILWMHVNTHANTGWYAFHRLLGSAVTDHFPGIFSLKFYASTGYLFYIW